WTAGALGVGAAAVLAAAAATWLRPAPRPAAALSATHRQLTKTEDVKQFPNMSPDGRWVVFVSAAAGNDDVYLQATTGLTAINLTKDAVANDTMPAFSPDGESIAFRSEREGGGLFVMGRTGESVRRLTRTGFYPSWFPDGQQIVFSTGGPSAPEGRIGVSEVWVADMTGGEPRRLLPADAVQPRVSPHGLRIAYWSLQADAAARRFTSTNRDIWTVDMTGMHAVRVTDDEAIDWNPVWSSDGQWLYFLSNRGGSMNLWRIAISEASGITHGEPEPVTAPAPYVAHFSMSADGRIGAYASAAFTSNIGRIAFDARSGTVRGAMQAVTAGPRDFTEVDVTTDKNFVVTR